VLTGCVQRCDAQAITDPGQVVWIGRTCWPYGQSLVDRARAGAASDLREAELGASLLDRSIFVECGGRAERVWAIEQAARCSGVAAVIADGSGLKMPETRRLQLVAETHRSLVCLARPPWETRVGSAAHTRWRVHPTPTTANEQAWRVEQLRCKGVQPSGDARRWIVRRDQATGSMCDWQACDVHLASGVVDRSVQTAVPRLASGG
jgi:hypothetical protein